MSAQNIDERVVEMRFNNKEFEENANQSIGTLGRLREALKLPDTTKALEGIDEAAKNISLDGIAEGVDILMDRFSTLGVVGMTVIQNITSGLMNKVRGAVAAVSDSIISGGIRRAMNIENAHFQLQALLKDEDSVQAVMDNAMESVDGTAYAYDEAAKAASQFAASGIQAGDEMLGALKGITGVAAMTNSQFEDISRIFTTVAGNGRLMGDQLLQLSSRGLNVASTLADYFREVGGEASITEADIREMVSDGGISFREFSDAMTWAFGDSAKRANETFTGAMSNVKSALARIGAGFVSPLVEQNGELVQLFNALRIKINDVKSALVFDEQRSAVSGLAKITGLAEENISGMFDTIKENGSVSIEDLDRLTNMGANATNALTRYINGVSYGSIHASYDITKTIEDLTNGSVRNWRVSSDVIRKWVEEGKIDVGIFQAAMEESFGDQTTLTKQFTDFFLDHLSKIVDAINSADLTKPMSIFYYWVEIVKDGFKGLYSILSPIGKAFAEVFLNFNADDIIEISAAIEDLTKKMRLSEDHSQDLHDAFKGIFDVGKLLIDIFFQVLGAIVPINKPVGELGDGFLDLVGYMGRALSSFTEIIRNSPLLKRVFDKFADGFSFAMEKLYGFIGAIRNFINTVKNLPGVQKFIDAINDAFKRLGDKVGPYIETFVDAVELMFEDLLNFDDLNTGDMLDNISDAFSRLADMINGFSFKTIEDAFNTLKDKIKELLNLGDSSDGLNGFTTNLKNFSEGLKEAFSLDNVLTNVDKVMDVFGRFFNWIKDTFGPAFQEFDVGNAIALGGGAGLIYSLIKMATSFGKIGDALGAIPEFIKTLSGVLEAYQSKIKADALIKIALGIAILAGSLVALSLIEPERLKSAANALGAMAAVLIIGGTSFVGAVSKWNDGADAAAIFAKKIGAALKKLTGALRIKALGDAILKFAESIVLITGAIAVIVYMYRKDPTALKEAMWYITAISVLLGTIAGLIVYGSNIIDPKKMSSLTAAILSISGSLIIIIMAIDMLMKLEIPADVDAKINLLIGVAAGLVIFVGSLMLFTQSLGVNQLPSIGGTIAALAIMLFATVLSLKMLFEMKLPLDWGKKVVILAGIFLGLIVLVYAIGKAAGASKDNGLKAAGSILALCLFVATIVGALFILTLIPTDKLLYGALALGGILLALGAALKGAGEIINNDNFKSILAMALMIGVITIALSVLSGIKFTALLSGAVGLGLVLGAVAGVMYITSKVVNKSAWLDILAMVAVVMAVSASLTALAAYPWDSLLVAAGTLSLVLITISLIVMTISSMKNFNLPAIVMFTIAAGLIIGFVTLSLVALASCPLDNLLASALSLTSVLLALSATLGVCSLIGLLPIPVIITGVLALVAFIGVLGLLIAGLGALTKIDGFNELMTNGGNVLVQIGQAVGDFTSALLTGLATGIEALLISLGNGFAGFMDAMSTVPAIAKKFDSDVLAGIGILTACILALTVGEVLAGISSIITGKDGFNNMATVLDGFMTSLQPFFEKVNGVDADALNAVSNIADMILKLTNAELLSGISSIFGQNISLADFGAELEAFGPHIASFALYVAPIKPEMVEGAIAAAEIVAGLYDKLPTVGGLADKIFGSNYKLSDFGAELLLFGPSLASFAIIVAPIKQEHVQGATAAAELVAALYEKLPNVGGLTAKIFGESYTLSEFGDELVDFGPDLVEFAKMVMKVRPEMVQGAASAAGIMSELANNLPETATLAEKIFGGENMNLSDFGDEVAEFGEGMAEFTDEVKDVDATTLMGVIDAFRALVDLASYIQVGEKTATPLVEFADELFDISTNSLTHIIDAFDAADTKFIDVANSTMTSISNVFNNNKETLIAIGNNIVNSLVTGMNENMYSVQNTAVSLANTMITSLVLYLPAFMAKGSESAIRYISGIKDKYISAMLTGMGLANNTSFGIMSVIGAFYNAGSNAGQGFIDGIRSKLEDARSAGREIAQAAYEAAKSALDEHSPSKKMGEVGNFAGMGFVGKLLTYVAKAAEAGKEVGEAAVDGVISIISDINDFDVDPTIRPIVDLSDVRNSVSDINKMFNDSINYTASLAGTTSSIVTNRNRSNNDQNGATTGSTSNTTYNFVQNNNSPKALSRIEIYRQTKNQFSQFKEATDKA